MGSAFLLLFPGYSGTPTPTSPTAIRLWETGSEYVYYVRFQFIRQGGGLQSPFKRIRYSVYCACLS